MSKHFEGLGKAWQTIFSKPDEQLPDIIAQTLEHGGSRTCWQVKEQGLETLVMAWPLNENTGLRIGVLMQGGEEANLLPKSVFPFLEGLPLDLTVEEVVPWKNNLEGLVSVISHEAGAPIWFYSPMIFRDKLDLTPGVCHTFLLAGLAYGLRPALLDELTITEGPEFERYCAEFLRENPDKTRLEVPQLTVELKGARIMVPDQFSGEYQLRVPISEVHENFIGPEKVYVITVEFGLNTPNPLRFPVYALERTCKNYVPKVGDEVDAIVWLQGRIAD